MVYMLLQQFAYCLTIHLLNYSQCICCHSVWIFPGQELGRAKWGRECPTQALGLKMCSSYGHSPISHRGKARAGLFWVFTYRKERFQFISLNATGCVFPSQKQWNLWQIQITAIDRKGQIYPVMFLIAPEGKRTFPAKIKATLHQLNREVKGTILKSPQQTADMPNRAKLCLWRT